MVVRRLQTWFYDSTILYRISDRIQKKKKPQRANSSNTKFKPSHIPNKKAKNVKTEKKKQNIIIIITNSSRKRKHKVKYIINKKLLEKFDVNH